ncbi:MAG: O-antigen ligase family protein [Armatimonadetes bacterium]|nr:O-antigen ligase family protein [Anaerolineae bacterium]
MASAVQQVTQQFTQWMLPPPQRGQNFPWYLVPAGLVVMGCIAAVGVAVALPSYAIVAPLIPVAVILLMLLFVRPEIAVILSVAYVPFESDKFILNTALGAFGPSKILGGLVLAVFFFHVVVRRRPFRLLDDTQDLLIMLLAAVLLFSGLESDFPTKTMDSTSRLLRMFLFYLAAKNLLTTPRSMRLTMWAMLISSTIATVIGITEYQRVNSIRNYDVRVGGVYQDPNDYAALIVMAVIVGVHLLEATRPYWLKFSIVSALGVLMTGVVLSGSRGALLALGLAMAVFIIRHPRWRLIVAVLAVSVVIAIPILPENIRARFLGGSDVDALYTETAEDSVQRRTGYVVFGTDVIAGNPVLGAGYGTFALMFPRSEFIKYDNPLTGKDRFRLAHNAYLEITFGTGFVGLALYLGIFFVTLRDMEHLNRWYRRGTLKWSAANGFQLGLVSLMISSFFLSIEHFNYTWIAVALSSSMMYQMRYEQSLLRETNPTTVMDL